MKKILKKVALGMLVKLNNPRTKIESIGAKIPHGHDFRALDPVKLW